MCTQQASVKASCTFSSKDGLGDQGHCFTPGTLRSSEVERLGQAQKAWAAGRSRSQDPPFPCITPPQAPLPPPRGQRERPRVRTPPAFRPLAGPCWASQASGHKPRLPPERPWAITSTPPAAASSSLPLHCLIKRPHAALFQVAVSFYME